MAFKLKSGDKHPMKFIASWFNTNGGEMARRAREMQEMARQGRDGAASGGAMGDGEGGFEPLSTQGMSTPQRIDTIENKINEMGEAGGNRGGEGSWVSNIASGLGGIFGGAHKEKN
jgi:hypothetical protein